MRAQSRHLLRLVPVLLLIVLTACGGAAPQATSGGGVTAPAPTAAPAAADTSKLQIPVSEATAAPAAAAPTAAAPAALEAQAPAGTVAQAPVDVAQATAVSEPLPPPTPQRSVEVNPFTRTTDDHVSTFAMDVDTASYTAARNYLNAGQFPPPEAVRVEEFVNYFHYDYPAPQQGAFGISVGAAPSPFGQQGAQIVRVGIQGQRIDPEQRSNALLTFVVDASGSMDRSNRLPLVKQSLHALVDELHEGDQVAIVVFGSESHVVLEPTSVAQRETILSAIDSLGIEGATDIEGGLRMAYKLATDHFKTGMINRVILCSDGEANVGATGPDAILQTIQDYKNQGVLLSTVGFGMGDYNDQMMERLADAGNGNYAFVDTFEAARRIFVENLTGTLQVIAKDSKIQVDFNPAVVSSYRLLGYENRAVADSDFRNDRVDAGEVGAGHSVTALYEVIPTGQGSGTALTVRVRYADPKTGEVHEIEQALDSGDFGRSFEEAAPRLQLAVAVAGFAEQLRGSGYAQGRSLADVLTIARRVAPQLANDPDVQEFVQLVERAQGIHG
jgi:Ca-activated chloride channel homolog